MTDITVSFPVPSEVGVTLRGFARKVDVTKLPAKTLAFLLEKGIQRGSNDPLGAQFEKGQTVAESEIDKYFSDLVERWNKGEVAKTRSGGLGRTTDPVQREIKRLANAAVDKSLTKLLVHHGAGGVPMTRKDFDEKLRAKYVAGHMERNKESLEREAKANLSKLEKAGEVELLDIGDDESGAAE